MNTTQELIEEIKRQAVDRHRLERWIAELKSDLTQSERRGDIWEEKAKSSSDDFDKIQSRRNLLYTALCRIACKRDCGEAVMRQAIVKAFLDLCEEMPPADSQPTEL